MVFLLLTLQTKLNILKQYLSIGIKKITELSHKKNAIVIGDGVSFAPHGFPDVKELGVDFYTFSLYKTYGPHLALLYGKEEILKKLPNQNHHFLSLSVKIFKKINFHQAFFQFFHC